MKKMVLAGMALALILTGCIAAGWARAHSKDNTAAVMISTGKLGASRWYVAAWRGDGQLCLGISVLNTSAPAPSPHQVETNGNSGACGFDNKSGDGYSLSADIGNAVLNVGPAPTAATKVQLGTSYLDTHLFPQEVGQKNGKWWAGIAPTGQNVEKIGYLGDGPGTPPPHRSQQRPEMTDVPDRFNRCPPNGGQLQLSVGSHNVH